MKKCISILTLTLCATFLLANQYWVEIAATNHAIDISSLKDSYTVQVVLSKNHTFRYYLGRFFNETDAERAKERAVSLGFPLARVLQVAQKSELCSRSCEPPTDLQNVFFDYGSARLRSQSRRDLNTLAGILNSNPSYKVTLEAHTDSHGNTDFNNDLSNRRAESAKSFLIAKGISVDRIQTIPHGESTPIASNDFGGRDNPRGRQLNRRVEINILNSAGRRMIELVKPIL